MQNGQQLPTATIEVTAVDCENLVKMLNRVQTTGIQEAQLLLGYAQKFTQAAQSLAPQASEGAEGENNSEE
jgi:hypothetical protein